LALDLVRLLPANGTGGADHGLFVRPAYSTQSAQRGRPQPNQGGGRSSVADRITIHGRGC
jgi:hypothetical protein